MTGKSDPLHLWKNSNIEIFRRNGGNALVHTHTHKVREKEETFFFFWEGATAQARSHHLVLNFGAIPFEFLTIIITSYPSYPYTYNRSK